MKTTGIIMSGDHPRKIIALLKTQTRRTYGLEKINENPNNWSAPSPATGDGVFDITQKDTGDIITLKCPYGQVGDKLRVRETWGLHFAWDGTKPSDIPPSKLKLAEYKTDLHTGDVHKWRSSRFMPKAVSRITLEITEVRVERVQEITEADARAEGVTDKSYIDVNGICWQYDEGLYSTTFQALWDSINAKKYPWPSNPWDWCITFRRIP